MAMSTKAWRIVFVVLGIVVVLMLAKWAQYDGSESVPYWLQEREPTVTTTTVHTPRQLSPAEWDQRRLEQRQRERLTQHGYSP